MLAVFCLRLALGLVTALLLLSPAQINPRFYRTHFLVVLALTAVAAVFLREAIGVLLGVGLAAGLLLAFAGSVVWSLEGAPGGRAVIGLSMLALATALVQTEAYAGPGTNDPAAGSSSFILVTSSFSSAALLGTATTSMLLGHSYLVAPGMSIRPLQRMLAALGAAVLFRAAVAGAALGCWTAEHSLTNLSDVAVLWLPVRWGLGLAGPLVLGILAWQTARLRSTQSATGILYVVVIFCFLGELTSQLLLRATGFAL